MGGGKEIVQVVELDTFVSEMKVVWLIHSEKNVEKEERAKEGEKKKNETHLNI